MYVTLSLSEILSHYKELIDDKIRNYLPTMGEKNTLREACEYTLLSGGKRFRPALVMMVANAVGYETDASFAAMAIEFFHSASLVADDLPCMDNENFRRGKPAAHKVYGESTAILSTYALISGGYECLARCGEVFARSNAPLAEESDKVSLLALLSVTENTGLMGASGGQFLDLNPPDLSVNTLRDIMHKKTVSLFEVAFVFGWLFGGGELKKLEQVKKAAAHFGMAFQIADDLGDMAQDKENECDVNFASALGEERAIKTFNDEMALFEKALKNLMLNSPELLEVAAHLRSQVKP